MALKLFGLVVHGLWWNVEGLFHFHGLHHERHDLWLVSHDVREEREITYIMTYLKYGGTHQLAVFGGITTLY
jgi:hypothetical protein